MNETTFEDFSNLLSAEGTDAAIEMLRRQFESSGDYYKLFEILKIRCRHRLGLPLTSASSSDAGDQIEQLESCLLEACKEVGTLLFRAGRPDEGWVYLQPLGDMALAKQLLMEIPVTDDNRNLIVDLGLGQSIAPAYAFEIMLTEFGTCNAITTIDVRVNQGGFAEGELEPIAEILLEFFYNEVLAGVAKDVVERGHDRDSSATLGDLLERHQWLVSETGHHVDATHLNSVVRIARNVHTERHFCMALDLCRYGQRLADDFKYPGDPPFESTYDDHEQFFGGLLSEHVDAAIAHFDEKIANFEGPDQTMVAEHVIAWLVRLGRREEAFDLHLSQLTGKETWGIAPPVIEIADSPELMQRLVKHFESTGDLLGFAVCKMQANLSN